MSTSLTPASATQTAAKADEATTTTEPKKPEREWGFRESFVRYGVALLVWLAGSYALLEAAKVSFGWKVGLEAAFTVGVIGAVAMFKELDFGRKIAAWGFLVLTIGVVPVMGWRAYVGQHEANLDAALSRQSGDKMLMAEHDGQIAEKDRELITGMSESELKVDVAKKAATMQVAEKLAADLQSGNGADVQKWAQEERARQLENEGDTPVAKFFGLTKKYAYNIPAALQCLWDQKGIMYRLGAALAISAFGYLVFALLRLFVEAARIFFRHVDNQGRRYSWGESLWAPMSKFGVAAIILGFATFAGMYMFLNPDKCAVPVAAAASDAAEQSTPAKTQEAQAEAAQQSVASVPLTRRETISEAERAALCANPIRAARLTICKR